MSMPPIIDATLQGALLCVASNVVAQYILCSRQGVRRHSPPSAPVPRV